MVRADGVHHACRLHPVANGIPHPGKAESDALPLEVSVQLEQHIGTGGVDQIDGFRIDQNRAHGLVRRRDVALELIREMVGVGEIQAGAKVEDQQPRKGLGVGMTTDIAIHPRVGDPAEHRRRWGAGAPDHQYHRQHHGHADAGQHADCEDTDQGDQGDSGLHPADRDQPLQIAEIAQAKHRFDDNRAQRCVRQVVKQRQQEHQG